MKRDTSNPTRSTCTLDDVEELITHSLNLLDRGSLDPILIAPVMIWGPPGCGKSQLFREFCAARRIRFVDVRLAQRDPVDMRGLPVPDGDVVRWLLSSEWPRDPDSAGIILFDELTAADRMLQVAAYEFILDRRLGDLYTVPPRWLICAAGNRAEDAAVATRLSSALANRFLHVEVMPDLEGWCRWARRAGVDARVIAFLRFRPELLIDMNRADLERGWPSPRSWARVSTLIEHGDALSSRAMRAGIEGLVGAGAAAEFENYLATTARLPDLTEVLSGRSGLDIPDRVDLRHALAVGLARLVFKVGKPARAVRILLDIGCRLPSDLATMMLADALEAADADQVALVRSSDAFGRWQATHGRAFQQGWTELADALDDTVDDALPTRDHVAPQGVADILGSLDT